MLVQRIITAIILIPLTLLALYYLSQFAFALLTAFIALGGAWEWSHLMQLQQRSQRWLYLMLMAFAFILGGLFIPVTLIFISAFIWWLFASMLIIFYPRASKWWSESVFIRGLMGIFVLLPCWVSINFIREQQHGFLALLFLFVIVWGADSAAYFVGKKWGKHKLAPSVSPGKSWQGLIGALIMTVLIAGVTLSLCQIPFSIWPWAILLSLVTVLFSVVGDLFESMMKRAACVKDSGRLIPGHGGLLDRIDSLTAAAPVFVFGAWVLGTFLA